MQSLMNEDGSVKVYIAFEAETADTLPVPVQPSWFPTRNSRGNYIPLKANKEAAIKAALEADCNVLVAAKAAKETTKWFVLTLTLNSVDRMQAWPTGLLHWSSNMRGVEWWGPLDENSVGQLGWEFTELNPIGLGSWTHMALTRRYYRMRNDAGMCTGCSAANVPVWAATRKFNKEEYCGHCWNDFVLSKFHVHDFLSLRNDAAMEE